MSALTGLHQHLEQKHRATAIALTTQAGFNTQYHNALGRFYTFNVTYRFM